MCLSWRSCVTIKSSGLNRTGTETVQLTSDSVNSEPAWSPDGRRIAFVRGQSSPDLYATDLYVMNADGSNVVRRTNVGSNDSPAWSPDGTKIAFSSVRDGLVRHLRDAG